LHHVLWYRSTNVSEKLAAPIFRVVFVGYSKHRGKCLRNWATYMSMYMNVISQRTEVVVSNAQMRQRQSRSQDRALKET